ncbi:ankyrin repeat-containing domain protein [Fusarium solani]|uniref:Ankyrin repeat-containing domain protein n=1 Tax=Fusarium solani TaxID=169388 RepID=A0A9P9JX74_FUSSL|nr:ankyrin repeat-containing domain protein [Fusarium solani]KAH7232124.1 ankyrin repeat-containing domain protein [Fusarium solani]
MIQSGKFSPCLRTDDGWTALHWAVKRSHPDVVAFLLTLPNTESLLACKGGLEGCTVLHFAVKYYFSSMVEAVLKAKADVTAQDRLGRISLYLTVWIVQEDAVEQLLSSGADPNIRSVYGTTLHCATPKKTLTAMSFYSTWSTAIELESFHGVQLKDLVTKENKWCEFVEGETA